MDVATVEDGRAALIALESGDFNLLIVDVYLPVMGGVSLIETLRKNEKTRDIPIVAVSAGGEVAREDALRAGADFFLDKPMRLADIVETVRRLTGLK